MRAGTRCASRARSAVRSNAGYDARLVGPSSAGSGMLQCTRRGWDGNSGQTSRTRSHSVITTSKRCATNSSRCLVRFPLMSMPALAASRAPRWRAAASGCCRRCPPDRSGRHVLEERLRDLRARAVARAQEQARVAGDPDAAPACSDGRWRDEPQPGMERAARRLQLRLGSERDRSRSSGRGRPPSCVAPIPAHRHAADRKWYDTRFCGSSTSCVSSHTARSLSTSSCNNLHRTGCATSRTNPGGSAAPRRDTTVGSTSRPYPPAGTIQSNQIDAIGE